MLIEIIAVLFEINLFIHDFASASNVTAPYLEPKIIGGRAARITEYPHAVFLIIQKSRVCGSSIVQDRVLLSAAHCFNEIPARAAVAAHVGSSNPQHSKQIIAAYKWIVHNHFSMTTLKHDICLIYLRKSIRLGAYAKKILLPQVWPKAGNVATVAGWGDTELKGGGAGNGLKSVTQIVRQDSICKNAFGKMDKSQLCAGYSGLNNLPYTGDSGSALVINGSVQIGIVSCGRPWKTGYVMYTSIMYYKNWIVRNVKNLRRTQC